MSRFRHALQDRDQHILTLRVFSGVLAGLLLMVTLGWMSAPDRLTIHNPPDLRSGSTRPWWEVPPSTVYSFAYYIFQQLNAWPKNGEVDYPAKIHALSAYLTPSCREILETCVFRSIRSRIGIEVRSAIRIHSINRELNFFYRFLTRFFAAFHYRGIFPQ